MKNHVIHDERVTTQRRKINSEACGILMFALLASIIAQHFILKAPFTQYVVELICVFVMSVYILARYLKLGLDVYGERKHGKRVVWLNGFITAVIFTAINGVLNYAQHAERYREDGIGFFIATLAVTFVSMFVSMLAVLSLINHLNHKRQEKIRKQLDADEQ